MSVCIRSIDFEMTSDCETFAQPQSGAHSFLPQNRCVSSYLHVPSGRPPVVANGAWLNDLLRDRLNALKRSARGHGSGGHQHISRTGAAEALMAHDGAVG